MDNREEFNRPGDERTNQPAARRRKRRGVTASSRARARIATQAARDDMKSVRVRITALAALSYVTSHYGASSGLSIPLRPIPDAARRNIRGGYGSGCSHFTPLSLIGEGREWTD